jgi:hypothetical protein
MATPTIVVTAIAGSGGGQAGYPVWFKLDIDDAGSTVGNGRWDEGLAEWEVIKADGSALDVADRISTTDPVNGQTVRLDQNQYGFAAMYPFLSAGTYKFRCRYQNSTGARSAWATTSTITIAARTGTAVYVDGARADDSGNGLSWATAKKTLAAAVTVLNAQSAGAVLYVRDCQSTGDSSAFTNAGCMVVSEDVDNPATITLTGNHNAFVSNASTNGVLIRGIKFASNSAGNGNVYNQSSATTGAGVCFLDCEIVGTSLRNFCTQQASGVSTGTNMNGLALINCTGADTASIDDAYCYGSGYHGLVIWGGELLLGGASEHTIRLLNIDDGADEGISFNWYHSITYGRFGCSTTKHWLRNYSLGRSVVFHCKGYKCQSLGFATEGDALPGPAGTVFRYDGCWFLKQPSQAEFDQALSLSSDWKQVTVANCYFEERFLSFTERVNEDASSIIDQHTIVHNTFNNQTYTDYTISWGQTLQNRPTNCKFQNNILNQAAMDSAYYHFLLHDLPDPGEGFSFAGNTIVRAAAARTGHDYTTTDNYTFAQWEALSNLHRTPGGTDNRRDSLSINASTFEPAAADTVAIGEVLPVISINGERYDPAAANVQSGAWLNPDDSEDARINSGRRSITIFAGTRRVTLTVAN